MTKQGTLHLTYWREYYDSEEYGYDAYFKIHHTIFRNVPLSQLNRLNSKELKDRFKKYCDKNYEETATNFTGESGGLNYTDYKDAYTNSCLIDINSINLRKRSKSLLDKKAERKNISYQMSEQDIKLQELKRIKEEKEEQERIARLKQYEEKAFNNYNEIHKRLLGR